MGFWTKLRDEPLEAHPMEVGKKAINKPISKIRSLNSPDATW
jgi:hypothetical protein